MDESLLFLLKRLLTKNRITVNEDELRLQLFGHPSYPSLHSITGVLDHFNISNLAIEIPKSEENISFLPDHFIAHIDDKEGDRFVLIDKLNQGFKVISNKNKDEILDLKQFIDIWTGVTMVIEKDELAQIETKSSASILNILLYISPALLIGLFVYLRPDFFQTLHFTFSIIGLAICTLITKHEQGGHSKILDKICSGGNDKINCDDVLNSKGATLFGIFFSIKRFTSKFGKI